MCFYNSCVTFCLSLVQRIFDVQWQTKYPTAVVVWFSVFLSNITLTTDCLFILDVQWQIKYPIVVVV